MAATNGHFPSDFDIARAIVAMWRKVGIEAELEVIEYAKYFELNRGNKLPEVTLYSWDNATGDPEIFAGYLLHPKRPFSAWKGMDVGEKLIEIATIVDYDKRVQAYKEVEKFAIEKRRNDPVAAKCHHGRAQAQPRLPEVRQWMDTAANDGLDMNGARGRNTHRWRQTGSRMKDLGPRPGYAAAGSLAVRRSIL